MPKKDIFITSYFCLSFNFSKKIHMTNIVYTALSDIYIEKLIWVL
jgi:hypothetical protein